MTKMHGGMRGKVTRESLEEQKAKAYDAATILAQEEHNLSSIVHTSYNRVTYDAYPVHTYKVVERDNGNLWVVDETTDTVLRIYVSGQWFGMVLMYEPDGHKTGLFGETEWEVFTPRDAYQRMLKDHDAKRGLE